MSHAWRAVVGVVGLAIFSACVTVKSDDLGHGFKLIQKRENSASAFERYSYVDYLKFRGQVLGNVGFVDVSPSGRFALYELEGRLMLFVAEVRTTVDVTGEQFAIPSHVTWVEQAGTATIHFSDAGLDRQIELTGQAAAAEASSHDAT